MMDGEKLQLEEEFSRVSSRVWTPKIVQPDDVIPDLFHYTNAAGLLGILRSRSLWATDFQSLNDASEMRYGMQLTRDLINVSVQKEPERKGFLCSATELLEQAFTRGATPYVVSFSDYGNLLSQWRVYGDRGAGFSIAFCFKESSTLFGDGTSVLKITYDPQVQRGILSATIEEYWNLLQRWKPKCPQTFDLPSAPEANIEDHCRCQLVSLLCQRKVRSSGFVQNEKFLF